MGCARELREFSRAKNPVDLPVQLAMKVALFSNLKTAKALGLDIPPTIIARRRDRRSSLADEIIE
jgi:putative ABC transport system substrate-binding protein